MRTPPAANAAEWMARRSAADERILWNKTCVECHETVSTGAQPLASAVGTGAVPLPVYAETSVTQRWMPRAAFDHGPHAMVTCESCHAARQSARTADVLMPPRAACATCHAPERGAESRCFECHRYHDWRQSHPVTPSFSLTDFK